MDIDGREIAKQIRAKIKERIAHEKVSPGLVFFLVGDHPPSMTYVGMKEKACKEIGIRSIKVTLPGNIAESELLRQIDDYNKDPSVHGILVQMPLPRHIDETKVIRQVAPEKDVDGFHPLNVGKMVSGDTSALLPCTPLGILKLLEYEKIDPTGKEVVVIGRSNIVGKPIANLLLQKRSPGNATVTIVHSKTQNLSQICRRADIIIAAIGKPNFVDNTMVKEGAVVIDVGINRTKTGLVGDVDYEKVAPRCSKITPVPGGVGPMTIAMLMYNTMLSCLQNHEHAI